jgi:hypothetical protein
MKFPKFREFRSGEVEKYLSIDLAYTLKELWAGINKLSFEDNFKSFTVDVEIGAGLELKIRNDLNEVPTGKIIIRNYGTNDIVDGDSIWNREAVFLKNIGASAAKAKVLFFK